MFIDKPKVCRGNSLTVHYRLRLSFELASDGDSISPSVMSISGASTSISEDLHMAVNAKQTAFGVTLNASR
jgi:hypothetical protein